jgi:hypothetical protein
MKARTFDDASSQYLETDSTPVTSQPFTMACWFNSDDAATLYGLMFVGNKASNVEQWVLYASGTTGGDPVIFAARSIAGGIDDAQTTTGYTAGTWHHACGVEIGAASRAVYIDGGSKGTDVANNTPLGADRFSVGRYGDLSPSNYMSGSIFWPAIWDAALDDDEVAALAEGIMPCLVRPESLVTWIYDENDWDYLGGYDLTATNTPTTSAIPPAIKFRGGYMKPPSGLFRRKSEHVVGRCR